jgi:maleate cis-trans isomerase
MYGHRARIGYCSPPFVTEVFAYEFYRIVPDGVTLMITTLEVGNEYTARSFSDSQERSLAAARAMAQAGADVVILGGNPVNQSLGMEHLPRICDELAVEIGVPVVASALAQREALRMLGARKVATVHMAGPDHDERANRQMRALGFESVGALSPVAHGLLAYGRIAEKEAITLAREARARWPEADCIHFANAHWPTAFAIDPVERELGVSVMASGQAVIWKALRTVGVREPIEGFGRLLREH